MDFVGRQAELGALGDWWEHAADRPALIWGRRRVGKTALIEHFAAGLDRVVFHTAVGDPMQAELLRFSEAVAAGGLAGLRDLTAAPYRDWRDALDHLAEQAASEPVLLVLDEFPELLAGASTLHDLTRTPVAVGEAKWQRTVDGARIKARLLAKAAVLTPDVDQLTCVVCARSEVTRPDAGTIVLTAADLFPDPGELSDVV